VPFTAEQTEKKVGTYELDVYGRVEGSDVPVIIENTYAAGLDAGLIIWVAT